MSMRSFAAALLAIVALALPAAAPAAPLAHAACGNGFRSATIGGAHKCLRSGEYCARRYEREYERYGYECSSSYSPPRLRRS
jgi:hypothetical protein